MVNQQKKCNKKLPSAVVVNDHMYPRPCLYMTPFGSKTIEGLGYIIL